MAPDPTSSALWCFQHQTSVQGTLTLSTDKRPLGSHDKVVMEGEPRWGQLEDD